MRPGLMAAVACAWAYAMLQLRLANLTSVLVAMAAIASVTCGAGIWIMMSRDERQALKALVWDRVQAR